MNIIKLNKRHTKPIIIVAMLMALLILFTSCEELGYPSPSQPAESPAPEPAASPATVIRSKDSAQMAVYQHLLNLAETQDAKLYLADFYTVCDNWTVESEYFKDGSGIWYIQVDMTESETWSWRPYWQQASWYVFKDGSVIPSPQLMANALRIEADLETLSITEESPEE